MQMNQQDQPGGSRVIDIASLASQQRGELEPDTRSSSSTARSVVICRVRAGARSVDSPEYDPQHVSIGPYHYPRARHLHLRMEDAKQASVDDVLSAAQQPGKTVDDYIYALACHEERARGCYIDGYLPMTRNEFVRMLLHDGCYILSCFYHVYRATAADKLGSLTEVVPDVFYLAENQIPFFVLEKIDMLTSSSESDGEAPAVNAIKLYALELLNKRKYAVTAPVMPMEPGNLLHLLHMHLKPSFPSVTGGGGEQVSRWRTATAYHLAGVKLKRRHISTSGDVRCILDVKLDRGGGTLEIPVLNIDGETLRLLRNLMALEQHNPRAEAVGSHVTAYCIFMSQLACEARDVKLLSSRRIIVHSLGNDEKVAEYFADLCRGIEFDLDDADSNYLRTTWQKVEKRYESRYRRWVAWLSRKYFSNPWLAVGLIAGAIGLTCAVVQAVYSVLSYTKGPNY